jgi:DNA-binding FadR family transcriptional regulator
VATWNTLDPQVLLLLRTERTLHELMELRFMVEPEAVAIAAARITEDELANLRPLLDPTHNVSMDKHVEADTAFHHAIIRATHNAVLLIFMSSVVDLLRESRRVTFQAPGAIPLGAAWHEEIMAALEAHDPERARNAMTGHLKQVEAALTDFATSHAALGVLPSVWFPQLK